MRPCRRTLVSLFSSALVASACAESASDMSAAEAPGGEGGWPSSDAGSGGSPTVPSEGDQGGAEPPPPENERDFDLRTPEAGSRHLFVPSASLDALIAVDGRDLSVSLIPVGFTPTVVRALPDDGGAIVLNEGSSDVTVVRPAADGAGHAFTPVTLPVARGANRLLLSPDGLWAFAWHDPRLSGEGSIGSAAALDITLQDVTAIHLAAGEEAAYQLSVGYRPADVQFAAGARLALIPCDDGLSVVDLSTLAADAFLPPIPTTHDIFSPILERELRPTPDGTAVVVRDLQYAQLILIDLATRTLRRISLPDFPSDLDMTPDGRHLLVPLRGRAEVAVIAFPEAFLWTPSEAAPEAPNPHIEQLPAGAPFGSLTLAADGHTALLHSTQPGISSVGLLDLDARQVLRLPLVKEVEAVAFDPTGAVAALQLRTASGAGDLRGQHAYALLDVASGYAKVVPTANPLTQFTFTPDGGELFVLLPDPAATRHEVHRVDTGSFSGLSYPVPDAPTFVGAMPQVSKMAIALDNPTGWITFVDTRTGEIRHLNSFELNGFVR